MIALGVNIDHVATLRQARRTYEPDPVWAAVEAQLGGADCLTLHLREDRRHIQDNDLERVKAICQVKLNLEMAATQEMVDIASRIKPHMATLVPEGRQEVTTEGGLDIVGQFRAIRGVVAALKKAGVAVSAFIDADLKQVAAAAAGGFSLCELHTGPWAAAFYGAGGNLENAAVRTELDKLAEAGRGIVEAGMRFNAGHALNYANVQPVAALPNLYELHIGHSIVSRSVFVGLRAAVSEMKRLMVEAADRAN